MGRVIGPSRFTRRASLISTADPNIEIVARHEVDPFQQNDLARLCGLYAPLNAIRLALHSHAPLSTADSRRLFEAGVDLIARKAGGNEALTSGMGTRRCRQIARCMAEQASKSTIAVEVQRPEFDAEPTTDDIVAWIGTSVAAGMPVLLRLKGLALDHFTTVAGLTPNQILLHDSAGLRFVKRSSCEEPRSIYSIPAKSLLRVSVRRLE